MSTSFFRDLSTRTPTRVWINNPTFDEIGLALANGAVGCTTNPGYGGGLLRRAPEEIRPIIADCVRLTDDDAAAADLVQMRLVSRIVERFRPLYDDSAGQYGYVSIQGRPDADDDPTLIVAQARAGHAIGPNATPKLPATAAGLDALEVIVADGCPVIVTEVFSLAQLVEACERYVQTTIRTGVRPPFFISPITGIFGDHLKTVAKKHNLPVAREDMELVGLVLGRECQQLVEERSYPVRLLCGGARISLDLLGMVGAAVHVTVNWSTFAEVLADPKPFDTGYEKPIDPVVLDRLASAFPDVKKAFALRGLTVDEFESFGPVQHFRNNFLEGWTAVRGAIAETRAELALQGSRQSSKEGSRRAR
ncbi:MAG: transaldolase family protein [Candidatus Limnocylindrales bacterium]|jgi:transaldolase